MTLLLFWHCLWWDWFWRRHLDCLEVEVIGSFAWGRCRGRCASLRRLPPVIEGILRMHKSKSTSKISWFMPIGINVCLPVWRKLEWCWWRRSKGCPRYSLEWSVIPRICRILPGLLEGNFLCWTVAAPLVYRFCSVGFLWCLAGVRIPRHRREKASKESSVCL